MANIAVKAVYGIITVLLGIFIVFPLVVFATFTFTLAAWFLGVVVLFKGLGAIRLSALQWWQGDDRNSPDAITGREETAAQARLMARSQPGSTSASQSSSSISSSNDTTRRHSNPHDSNVSLATLPQVDHDYESMYSRFIRPCHFPFLLTYPGISGWLHPEAPSHGGVYSNDNSSQTALSTPTRRPDTTPPIYRRRSFGASSNGINSPDLRNTPSSNRHSAMSASALHSRSMQGSGSPQSYSNNGTAARSTTLINSRRGSVLAARRESEAIGSGSESEEDRS
jgi:hypothetical protein